MTRTHPLASHPHARHIVSRLALSAASLAAAAIFAACSLTNAPTNQAITISGAPIVRIVAPPPNATYLEGVRVNTQALVSNAGADIARVEIAVDGAVVQTLDSPNTNGVPSFSVVGGWQAAGIGAHTASVTAFRADGTRSEPAEVAFTIVADRPTDAPSPTTAPTQAVTATPRPTQAQVAPDSTEQAEALAADGTAETTDSAAASAPEASAPPAATASSGDATAAASGRPQATFNQGINVRSGPSTLFVPPIGSFAAGQTTEITAVNTDGTWWKVRYYNGEGWIFAGLATSSGNLASLPRDPGPPLPTATSVPVLPTAAPVQTQPTAAPASTNVNLVAGDVVLDPPQPVCNGTFTIGFDVANLGTAASAASSTVSLTDVRKADGTTQQTTTGGFPILQPGQTFRVNMPLTVSTFVDEDHEIRLVIDPTNLVPETVDGDNSRVVTYRLARGSCP